ncbi:MAG: urea carboxylase-associated family protein [Rhodobacteraceae bacterium]|nr:urea carboxylase-associated family protein [Paracoccaceae bacterium]
MGTDSRQTTEIPARAGVAVPISNGQRLKLINTFGSQVVDTWAISAADPSEYMSMEHTRRVNGHLHPVAGDFFLSNRRRPMLLLEEDSFPGTHDTIVACCDSWLYRHLGAEPGHANCSDNFLTALKQFGVTPELIPNPLNLWMNVPVEGNSVRVTEPLSRPGDHVTFRAEAEVVMVFSTCPMDLPPSSGATAINGADCTPKPVHFTVF